MKKIITLLLSAILTLSLAACAGTGGAKPSGAPQGTPDVTATPSASATPEPLDTITLDFAELVLEQVGVADEVKINTSESLYKTTLDEDGAKAIYLIFKIKNISTEAISASEYFAGNVAVGEYSYKTEYLSGMYSSELEPLKTAKYAVYAQIPDELVDTGKPFVFNIGCNDMFTLEWGTEVSNCQYQYTYTVTKNGDAFAVEAGSVVAGGESASGRAGTLWEKSHYVDDFNQPTEEAFVLNNTYLVGTFSNSATTDATLYGDILIDNENMAIMLYEYGRKLVKNSSTQYDDAYDIKMKAADGTITDMQGSIWIGNDRIVIDEAYRSNVINALSALPVGDVAFVSFYIVESDTPTTNYLLLAPMSNFGDVIETLVE